MASIATTRLRLDKQATGDNPNAWGIRLNAALDLIDESQGVSVVVVNDDVTLTSNNYTSDQSRRAVLRFTGAGGFIVTVPAVEKLYTVDNQCAANVIVKTASGASAVIRAGTQIQVIVDAVNSTALDPTLDKIKPAAAAVDLNGQRLINAADATTDTGLVTRQQTVSLTSGAVTLAQAWATQLTGEVVAGQGFSARYHANLASGSASAAATSAGNSAGSAALANQWAISLTLVDGSFFGARKYAIDAAASAAAAALFDPSSYYTKTQSDARYAPIGAIPTTGQIVGLSYGPDSLS